MAALVLVADCVAEVAVPVDVAGLDVPVDAADVVAPPDVAGVVVPVDPAVEAAVVVGTLPVVTTTMPNRSGACGKRWTSLTAGALLALECLRGGDVVCGTACQEARSSCRLEIGRGADTAQVSADKGSMRCDTGEHRDILACASATCEGCGQAIGDARVETGSGSPRCGGGCGRGA